MGYGVPDSGVDFVYITVHEAYALMKNDKAVFVDSRDLENYDATRLQTSFHMAANDLIFAKTKVDQAMVQHLIDLTHKGKTVVALSDACITGARNRGHVSRCRHVAQYLVELGADRTKVVRMTGGINAWKQARLDGVLGGLLPMFAGAFQDETFKTPEEPMLEGDEEDEPPAAITSGDAPAALPPPPPEPLELAVGRNVELKGLNARADLNGTKGKVTAKIEETGRWEVEVAAERVRVKPENILVLDYPTKAVSVSDLPRKTVCCGGDVSTDGVAAKQTISVIDVPPREWRENTPTAYRVLKGEVFRKPARESDKIIKTERPISSIVRTTGETHEGGNGGKWAELDVTAGEKKGWVYLEGPGFGPSTRKVRSEYLRA